MGVSSGMRNAHGTLEYARPHGKVMVLRGWMVDRHGPFEKIVVRHGSESLADAMPIERPDLAEAIQTLPRCEDAGFHVEIPLELFDKRGHAEVILTGMRDDKGQAVMKVGCMILAEDFPTPPPHLSQRVAHTELDYLYHTGGVKTACDFHRAAARNGAGSALRILDWGSGPGRVTTHLATLFPGAHVTGTDLDHEALAWASKNLTGLDFVQGNPEPPLPFPDNSFDLITGGSVFTHLTREMQVAWLAELGRLLAPGGRAVVTTLGSFAAEMRSLDKGLIERLAANGFDDQTPDRTLDGVAPDGYYRGTWQTIDWTRKAWGEQMEVLEVEQAGYENYQDLWVLGK